tara:strand:+ start:272 stop:739 length:468 start_codon:yes stop_codon:yes gene_type:complete
MIHEIDYEYDTRALRLEAEDMKGYEPFVDPKNGNVIDKWLIKREVTGYARWLSSTFEKMLDTAIKPRFYIQEKGFTLPFHRDRGTTCAVNFILSTSRDPIRFKTEWGVNSYQYTTAIVDVSREHEVRASSQDRYLFKLSIFDKSYEEVVDKYNAV